MPPRILSSKTCRGATGSFFTCLIRIRRSNNGLEAICELNHVLIRPEAFLLPQTFHLDYEITKLIIPGDIPMNPTAITTEGPLHILLRQRRQELSLVQSQLAEVLHVSPECIGQWECGRRRMELSKLPRIVAALKLDPRELWPNPLAECHPPLYASLFGGDALAEHQPGPR